MRVETAQAELALADLLQDEDSDVREAAAEARRLLRPERAVRWLEHRLRDETDAEVRQTIRRERRRPRIRCVPVSAFSLRPRFSPPVSAPISLSAPDPVLSSLFQPRRDRQHSEPHARLAMMPRTIDDGSGTLESWIVADNPVPRLV